MRAWFKWELVGLLWFSFFLQHATRQLYGVVLPALQSDLKLSSVQVGLVATGFILIYGLLVPVAGGLADLWPRKWVLTLSLVTFSAGTLLTGGVAGLFGLLLFRSLTTGAGQSLYFPSATSLIGQHHQDSRGLGLGIHQTAQYTGIIGSSWLAGLIAEHYGWRMPFVLFGAAGLVLALVFLGRLPSEPVQAQNQIAQLAAAGRVLLRKPTFYLFSLGFAGMGFVTVGFLTWLPTYLYEQYQLPLREAAFHAMLIHYVAAAVGVALFGRVSDALACRRRQARLELIALGLLGAVPCLYLLGQGGPLRFVYLVLAVFGLLRGLADANWMAGLFDFVPVRFRASAVGLLLCLAFVVGSLAPLLLGAVRDRLSLGWGISALAVVYLVVAILIWVSSRWYFDRDWESPPVAVASQIC